MKTMNVMENDDPDDIENDDDYQTDDLAADYTSDGDCVLFLIVILALIIIITIDTLFVNNDDDFSQILDQITLPADEELWTDDSFPHYAQQQMTMKYGSVENILIILSRRCHVIDDKDGKVDY